ncbi:MAG TPA: ThiF family adenylyltransferase [Microthrixaceae bacterium]|nr:ThiF family adenylyltransferase [Microthrixaceae bacterium]
MTLTDAQTTALDDLRRLSSSASVLVVGDTVVGADLVVQVTLNTTAFEYVEGGLQVETREQIFIVVTPGFPWVPPQVRVAHHRWAGFPHVLQGSRLCLYLDPATEWNPLTGVAGFLGRLWDWFADAIANRFDPTTALYQPVGGVFHRTDGAPTVVVTDVLGDLGAGFRIASVALRSRTEHRVDLLADSEDIPADGFRGVLVVLSDGLPYGGGLYLSDLAVAIRGQDSRKQRKQFLTAITKAAHGLPADGHLHVVIAVPNRHLAGQARFHLIGWRLPRSAVTKAIEATSHRHQPESPHPDDEPRVQWTYVDDVRTAVTTRRDHERPVNWFEGKTVELWGCGALGSWIAEILVRAGAARITLRDTGYVTAGLLVRQNFTELDIGRPKVAALADRLRAISDHVAVLEQPGLAQAALQNVIEADIVIDCTVNTGVAVAIDQAQASGALQIPVMQVATDNDSATLGILTIASGSGATTTSSIDSALRHAVAADIASHPYLPFWSRDNHPTLTPTVGCSVPTFHGASTDVMAVASQAISLGAIAVGRGLDVGYVFATAHSPYSVPQLVAAHVEADVAEQYP